MSIKRNWLARREMVVSLAMVALTTAPLSAASSGDSNGTDRPAVQAAPVNVSRLIISYRHQPGLADAAALEALGGAVRYVYRLVPAIAVSLPADAAVAAGALPGVALIEPDVECFAIDINNTWGVERIGGGFAHAQGARGAGVRVGILDTGLDYNHPEFAGRFAGGYNFVGGNGDPMDDHFHGTHVSGTIGAALDLTGVVGAAPEVELYALKVLNARGSGNFADVIAALQWCVDHDIHVTNQSLGSFTNPGQAVENAYNAAWEAGILHVAAAGNFYGIFGVSWPARYDSVIAVGATDRNNNHAAFSDSGPQLELAAPGVDIRSTMPGGGYGLASGTSMASPHVAGAAALVIAAGIADANNNGRVNDEVRDRLGATAIDLGREGRDSLFGFGLVNAQACLAEPMSLQASDLARGQRATFVVSGARGGATVALLYSVSGTGPTPAPQLGVLLSLASPMLAAIGQANANGVATFERTIPANAPTIDVWLQAAAPARVSRVVKRHIN